MQRFLHRGVPRSDARCLATGDPPRYSPLAPNFRKQRRIFMKSNVLWLAALGTVAVTAIAQFGAHPIIGGIIWGSLGAI